jgi:23S rRNA (cytidine1920-2'-O)/16S rRNA (cytidine1409-2'-O)-methyltransferase
LEALLTVKAAPHPYASKGGLKLEGALRSFGVSPEGLVCLDVGASTGGFTDCLLCHGAARVYAVDVGFGQLSGRLRADPRVVNLERTNLADPALLCLDPPPVLASVDLSYLSLRKAVPLLARILPMGTLLCLVKPLFEVEDAQARRTGQIPDTALAPLLLHLCQDLAAQGHAVRDVTHSPITGNASTREFFLHVQAGQGEGAPDLASAIDTAILRALALEAYRK